MIVNQPIVIQAVSDLQIGDLEAVHDGTFNGEVLLQGSGPIHTFGVHMTNPEKVTLWFSSRTRLIPSYQLQLPKSKVLEAKPGSHATFVKVTGGYKLQSYVEAAS